MVIMQHVDECKELMPIVGAVTLLSVDQTKSRTLLVQAALSAVPTVNASLKLEVNAKIECAH